MGRRYEVRAFTRELADDAAVLLAERHRRHRAAWPALDPAHEDPATLAPLIAELAAAEHASGAFVSSGGQPAAYVIATRKPPVPWGENAWVSEVGNAGNDHEAIRVAYGAAAREWAAAGRRHHYVVVPATEAETVDAWFSLSFGLQHVHAFRDPPPADFQPYTGGLTIRRAEASDVPALLDLDAVLPRHGAESPTFAPVPLPNRDESLAEIQQDLNDPRFTSFVAEHDGHVIGTATAVSLEMSNSWSPLMRPPDCGFLGFAAVLPAARGLGAGRALADAVLAWSRAAGFKCVATDWRSANLEANRTWRSVGFQPAFYRLSRIIG